MGREWSPWETAGRTTTTAAAGLYHLRGAGAATLTYVGQGRIADRVAAHLVKTAVVGHRQAAHFAAVQLPFRSSPRTRPWRIGWLAGSQMVTALISLAYVVELARHFL